MLEDGRRRPVDSPSNALSEDKATGIVSSLANEGIYVALESSFYRARIGADLDSDHVGNASMAGQRAVVQPAPTCRMTICTQNRSFGP